MDKQGDSHDGDGAKKKDGDASDASPKLLPLHRRRFDAKQRVFPSELTDLPSSSMSARPPQASSRKICEDLAERLQNRDESTPDELQPLYARSANAAAAALITEDAFDHLDKLYKLMEQLLTLKEQNSKIQRRVRDLEHIKKLQEMHQQIEKEMSRVKSTDPDAFYRSEATSMDMGEEYEYTEALLDSMLEAGRNASLKRAKWKSPSRSKLRQSIVRSHRSRSMGGEELESCPIPEGDYTSHLMVPYKGRSRRASEGKRGDKAKISKWTRVKAAFKWEKAHTGIAGETPVPSQVARASLPCGSFNTVSLTPASPLTPVATPASISPASSTEDIGENDNCMHDGGRRSRSLDSSVILDPISGQLNHPEEMCSPSHAKLHKTPWGKMKDIIQTRKESVRKKQNRSSIRSSSGCRTSENYSLSDGGGLSQSESAEVLFAADNNNKSSPKRKISGQEKSSDIFLQDPPESAKRTTPTLTVTMPSSEELAKVNKTPAQPFEPIKSIAAEPGAISQMHRPEAIHGHHQLLTKQKSLDMTKKPPSRPVQDSSDVDASSSVMHRHDSKWKKVKKAFLTSAPASTPSSPSRNSAFFSYEADDIRANCMKSRVGLEDEVRRDYEALQSRLSREFYDKAAEWNSGGSGSVAGNSPSGGHSPNQQFAKKMDEWEKMKCTNVLSRQTSSGPSTPAEEKLSAEFRKKLQEWQKAKNAIPNQTITTPAPIYPNIPTHAQLSEDFRKKLEEWKRLKATNSVPVYTGEDYDRISKEHEKDEKSIKLKKVVGPQKKEVLVQTGAGFFRFEGISRSFTRKLHEWEKSRGIAPEASTTALLRESLARPPLPITRSTGYGPWPSGYQKNERGVMRLQRSQSAGSVRDDMIPHVSTSASSVSLTHLEECSNNDNQVSDVGEECFDTSLETEIRPLGTESDSDGGPGAVLVEVEDEVEETAAPLVACSPCAAPQTPIYRYGQAQERHRACESTDGKLTPVAYAISTPPHPLINKIFTIKDMISLLIQEEESIQKLVVGRNNVVERYADVSKKIEKLKDQSITTSSAFGDLKRRLTRLEKEKELLQNSLSDRLFNFNELIVRLCSEIHIMKNNEENNVVSFKKILNICIQKIEILGNFSKERHKLQNNEKSLEFEYSKELKQIASYFEDLKLECTKFNNQNKENNLCITYTANKTKPKETFIKIELEENEISENIQKDFEGRMGSFENIIDNKEKNCYVDLNETTGKTFSSTDDKIDETAKGARKKVKDSSDRTSSNIVKRKSKARQRLEREKSLHSESDTEEEVNTVTVEFPRRKKPIKSKSLSEAQQRQNSFEKQYHTDSGDNVFVLKLKSKSYDEHSPINNERDSSISDSCTKQTIIVKKGSFDSAYDNKSDLLSDKTDSVEILISSEQLPIDIPPEGIEVQAETSKKPDIFVKTTRKIFSPVRRDGKGETKAVIGVDLEEIANSISKTGIEKRQECQENLPDILVNNDMKKVSNEIIDMKNTRESESEIAKMDGMKRQLSINTNEPFNKMRSHSQSPLFKKKNNNFNESSRTFSVSRNPSEESIGQTKEILSVRRGSGERYINTSKGSPVLSRASTPGIMSASLPPLPASPPTSRRDKPPSKETAPSIRIMIQKYNMKLNEEGTDQKSSCGAPNTPPWRSPRSQERFPHDIRRTIQQNVRNNPFYNREVQKSASASQIMKNPSHCDQDQGYNCRRLYSKENINDNIETTPPLPKKMLRGILKSSSAGSIKNTTPLSQRKDYHIKTKNVEHDSNKNYKVEIPVCNEKNNVIPQPTVPTNDINNSETKTFSEQLVDKTISNFYGKKIDEDLLKLAKSSTCIPIQQYEESVDYNQSQTPCSRAIKLKKAKEKFLATEIKNSERNLAGNLKRNNSTTDNIDFADNRLSQISCGSDTSYEGNSLSYASNNQNSIQDNSLLIKSASVGMINLEKQAFENFNREKGYESLPRNQTAISVNKEISKSSSKFGLSNLASKFRKVRLRGKSKQSDKTGEKEKLDTVTKLCRQSLLVNLHGDSSVDLNKKQNDNKTKSDKIQSQTDKSIFLAGKTGTAVAVNNEEVISQFHRSISRSSSKSDNLPSCSKSSK